MTQRSRVQSSAVSAAKRLLWRAALVAVAACLLFPGAAFADGAFGIQIAPLVSVYPTLFPVNDVNLSQTSFAFVCIANENPYATTRLHNGDTFTLSFGSSLGTQFSAISPLLVNSKTLSSTDFSESFSLNASNQSILQVHYTAPLDKYFTGGDSVCAKISFKPSASIGSGEITVHGPTDIFRFIPSLPPFLVLTTGNFNAAPGALKSVSAGTGLVESGTSTDITLGIRAGGVSAAELAAGAVTGDKIGSGAVTRANIASGNVVKTLNGVSDDVTVTAGAGVNITTSGNTVTVAAPNSFTPGGDLTGNATSQQVSKLQGTTLSLFSTGTGTGLGGTVIGFNNGAWVPVPAFSPGGDLVGGATNQTVSKIQSVPFSLPTNTGTNLNGTVLGWTGAAYSPIPGFVPGGDLSGSAMNQVVSKLQGSPLALGGTGTLSAGQVLGFNGTTWTPTTLPAAINNKGAWKGTVSYNANDAVFDAGSFWVANVANTNSEPSAMNAQWQVMAAGINHRGPWSGLNSYNVNDAVSDLGSYWLAMQAVPAGLSSEPSTSNANWLLLAAQGAPGQPGPAGAAGQSVVGAVEAPGANCAFGGSRFTVSNGATYACNGVPGAAGAPGVSVLSSALAVGDANCPFGGTKLIAANGTTYVCNGGTAATFRTISGTLSGLLPNTTLILHDNGTDDLTLGANGAFTFPTPLAVGTNYAVTATSPANQTCTVTNGTGTVGGSNVSNIAVNCVSPLSLVTLASGQDHPSSIAVDGTDVYWGNTPTNASPGAVMHVSVGGGTPTVFTAVDTPIALALDLNNVYFTAFNGYLIKATKSGGVVTTLGSGMQFGNTVATFAPFFGLTVDAQNTYFTNNNLPPGCPNCSTAQAIVSVSSIPAYAVTGLAPLAASTQPYGIALDPSAQNVYWTVNVPNSQGTVMKVPRTGGTPTTIASGQNSPAGIAVDANNVYWTNNLDGTVMKAPIAGGTPTIIASGQSFPFGIAIDDTYVYWTNNGTNAGGTVMKAPIAGGSVTTLASGQNFPLGIAVDGTSVYWTNNLGGTVMKRTPK